MSWKATAYVKDLTNGISHTEKLLLFVLADYHNTAKRIAWPSISVLAKESLMSERSAQRILARLESKGLIHRVMPTADQMARHETSLYEFPSLDDTNPGRHNDTPKSGSGRHPGCHPGRHSGYRNKEEPVIEPVKENGETPEGLHPLQYAAKLMEEIGMPDTFANKRAVEAGITAEVKGGRSLPATYEFLLALALDARGRSEPVDKFWFEDTKWRNSRNGNSKTSTSASAARSERSKQNILDGFAANARRANPPV